MQNFIRRLDELAGIDSENKLAAWLERLAFALLTLMFLCAPYSIAATETAWLAGMVCWAIRIFFIKPRRSFVKTPLNVPLLAFVGWTVLTCFTSYAPAFSFDRLRNVSVFLAFFFIVNNVRTRRAAIFLAFALIFACMGTVLWTGFERAVGRGIEIEEMTPDSPLAKTTLVVGDTLLKANGKKISTPEQLETEIEHNDFKTTIFLYRDDYYISRDFYKENLKPGNTALERLGLASWKPSRVWRSQAFFSHWVTYAEILQLIGSLTLGLLAAASLVRGQGSGGRGQNQEDKPKEQLTETPGTNDEGQKTKHQLSTINYQLLFAFCLSGILFALMLTTTRSSQFSFGVAAFVIIWLMGKRKWLIGLAAIVLPLAIFGAIYIQQTRKVSVLDSSDGSTQYRLMMYRDGARLWTMSVRNFTFGIGMDSIIAHWQEWGLFDKGWQPLGHFHSNYLQIAFERGLPALLLWLWVLWRYGRLLMQSAKRKMQNLESGIFDWKAAGILLGCFGGFVGFVTSGVVQNNLGDAQVATVFYMLMGLGTSLVVSCEW